MLPVVVGVVGCVTVDVVHRDPVGVSFPVDVLDVNVNVVVDDVLAVVLLEVVVVVLIDLDVLPVGVVVDGVLAVVVADLLLEVDKVLEVDKDKALSLNNSAFSLSEALLEDDDGEDARDDNQAGAPVAPSRRGGQAESFWSSMFCW